MFKLNPKEREAFALAREQGYLIVERVTRSELRDASWLNAWHRASQSGVKYLSLVMKPKGENAPATPTTNNSEDVRF